jgi:hypothetical protein
MKRSNSLFFSVLRFVGVALVFFVIAIPFMVGWCIMHIGED